MHQYFSTSKTMLPSDSRYPPVDMSLQCPTGDRGGSALRSINHHFVWLNWWFIDVDHTCWIIFTQKCQNVSVSFSPECVYGWVQKWTSCQKYVIRDKTVCQPMFSIVSVHLWEHFSVELPEFIQKVCQWIPVSVRAPVRMSECMSHRISVLVKQCVS